MESATPAGKSAVPEQPMAERLTVAAVQFRSSTSLDDNLARMRAKLEELAAKGVRVAAFPECAVTRYDGKVVEATPESELVRAEGELSRMCRECGIYALAGMPYRAGGKLYNGGLAWDPDGKLIARYAKIYLAEKWPVPGDHFVLFRVDGVPCSMMICHDVRYPELVRLPVLAGAQIMFDLSCESTAREEWKIDPYRGQVQARAQENCVFVVQSNAPENIGRLDEPGGSHGQSRIIAPDGRIMGEATIFQEETIVAEIEVKKANRAFALRSLQSELLKDWWAAGVKLVAESAD